MGFKKSVRHMDARKRAFVSWVYMSRISTHCRSSIFCQGHRPDQWCSSGRARMWQTWIPLGVCPTEQLPTVSLLYSSQQGLLQDLLSMQDLLELVNWHQIVEANRVHLCPWYFPNSAPCNSSPTAKKYLAKCTLLCTS